MRIPALIIGLLLLIAGGLITAGSFTYHQDKELLKIGDASLTVSQEKPLPKRLGYGLLAAGAAALVLAAASKK